MKSYEELRHILMMANDAKDRLYRTAQALEEAGFHRKAESCMTIIYKIEEWQRKK